MTTYTGSCHCGAVKYEFDADVTEGLSCNCSHCHRKGFVLAFIPKEDFRIVAAGPQTEYFFNKKAIKHLFCTTCGVQSYAEGIAFPQMAINLRCVDGVDLETLPLKKFEGKDA